MAKAKKWELSWHELKKWAEGNTIYVEMSIEHRSLMVAHEVERLIQLIENGKVIEYSTEGGDVCDISRQCLEDLALQGYAWDEEFDINYYDKEHNGMEE